jgi:preprotein translocase subunit YajC
VESLLFFAVILVAFYFLIIRPQRNRARQAAQLQARLVPGVEIMTTAGMFGRVTEVLDDGVVLEISPGVQVRFAKAAVGRIVDTEAADDVAADDVAADSDAEVAGATDDASHDQAGSGRTSAGE